MEKTILLAGGTGLIGTRLSLLLRERGYVVRLLTRTPGNADEFKWNPLKGELDESALQNIDYVVNLAGAGIADKRWTADRKRDIVMSRVQAAQVLAKAFTRMDIKPKAYISASAIGYYGNSGEQFMTEADAPVDNSFMVECCQQWEAAADTMLGLGIRTVKLRIGIVLAKEGGALAEVVKPLHWGLGTYFGNGRAWWSWIHRDDLCRMILWAFENTAITGVFNAVAPQPVRGLAFTQTVAKAINQKAVFLPAPEFALKLILGEMAVVVLNSNHISGRKVEQAGFEYSYPDLQGALAAIFQA
jgi:uncharacterized protein (TIGR01777 family)